MEAAGAVPVELLDESHAVWVSVPATRKWLDAKGLTIDQRVDWGPINRCLASGSAWALRAGIVRTVSYGSGKALDLEQMRELGIRAGWGGGSARERWELRKRTGGQIA